MSTFLPTLNKTCLLTDCMVHAPPSCYLQQWQLPQIDVFCRYQGLMYLVDVLEPQDDRRGWPMSDNCLQALVYWFRETSLGAQAHGHESEFYRIKNRCRMESPAPAEADSHPRREHLMYWLMNTVISYGTLMYRPRTTDVVYKSSTFGKLAATLFCADNPWLYRFQLIARGSYGLMPNSCNDGHCSDMVSTCANIRPVNNTVRVYRRLPAVVSDVRPVTFGRYRLSVTAAASCSAFDTTPLSCAANENNCSVITLASSGTGISDYDMLPPAALRHGISAQVPRIDCTLSDFWLPNLFAKIFASVTSGKWIEYWLGIQVKLVDVDLEPAIAYVLKSARNLSCDPDIVITSYKLVTGQFLVAPDSVVTDHGRYGDILNYDNHPPTLGKFHYTATGERVEIWSLQIDRGDVTVFPYPILEVGFATCFDYEILNQPCDRVEATFSGAYSLNLPVFVLTSTKPCFARIADGVKTAYYELSTSPTLARFVGPTIVVDGRRVVLPPAPKLTDEFVDQVTKVTYATDFVTLIGVVLSNIVAFVAHGPEYWLQVVVDKWLDASMAYLAYSSLTRLKFRWVLLVVGYWFFRLYPVINY